MLWHKTKESKIKPKPTNKKQQTTCVDLQTCFLLSLAYNVREDVFSAKQGQLPVGKMGN